MTDAFRCNEGDWVEVERVLLEPAERAAGIPDDTAAQPLRVWVKGFALGDGLLGDEVEVETMTGRTVRGNLSAVQPGYTHTFGTPPAEIVHIGRDLRARIAEYRASVVDEAGAAHEPAADAPKAGE